MAVLKPPGPRFQTERTARGVRIIFPPRRNGRLLLFNGAWLGAWAFGEFTVLSKLLDGDFVNAGTAAFLVFWLIAWTVGGALILRAWLSNLVGSEVVEVGGGSLMLWKKLGPFSRNREFDLQHLENLRVSPSSATPGAGRARQIYSPAGALAFDYGSRTFRFGGELDDAEATEVVSALEPHLIRQPRATVTLGSHEGLSRD